MAKDTLIPKTEIVKFLDILIDEYSKELPEVLTRPSNYRAPTDDFWAGNLYISRTKIYNDDDFEAHLSRKLTYEYALGIRAAGTEYFNYIDKMWDANANWIKLTRKTLTIIPANRSAVSITAIDLYDHYAEKLEHAIVQYEQAKFAKMFQLVVDASPFARKVSIDTFLADNQDDH